MTHHEDATSPALGSPAVERGVMPHATAAGTCTGYSVEARVDGPPRQLGKYLLDGEWRTVQFDAAPNGVPGFSHAEPWLAHCGLLRYESAQALRWWLMAEAVWGVRTRLVRHKVQYSMQQYKGEPEDEQGDLLLRGIRAA